MTWKFQGARITKDVGRRCVPTCRHTGSLLGPFKWHRCVRCVWSLMHRFGWVNRLTNWWCRCCRCGAVSTSISPPVSTVRDWRHLIVLGGLWTHQCRIIMHRRQWLSMKWRGFCRRPTRWFTHSQSQARLTKVGMKSSVSVKCRVVFRVLIRSRGNVPKINKVQWLLRSLQLLQFQINLRRLQYLGRLSGTDKASAQI